MMAFDIILAVDDEKVDELLEAETKIASFERYDTDFDRLLCTNRTFESSLVVSYHSCQKNDIDNVFLLAEMRRLRYLLLQVYTQHTAPGAYVRTLP